MSDYAIGDVQGCYDSLQALLAQIRFDRRRDRVWLTGDLVNRGPRSLDVLRWATGLGDRAIVVLGNHDVHLLSIGMGAASARPKDTLDDILTAPDRDELLGWLRFQPLFHRESGFALVHAGLLPQWTLERADELAREAESALRGPGAAQLLADLRKGKASTWRDDLTGNERIGSIIGVLTRIRACTAAGELAHDFAGPPESAPPGTLAWYAHANRASRGQGTIVFGHWAAQGYRALDGVVALDSGCAWGQQLTAMRLEDGATFQQRAID